MNIAYSHPWLLGLALLVFVPWLRRQRAPLEYSWLPLVPEDALARRLETGIRLLAATAILALVLALAGPFQREHWVERVGTGAHVVMLFDRSASMNENFSGRYLGGKAGESKASVARNLLIDFVRQRENDLFAMISFSTAPIYMMPLTQDREAILAAIRSTRGRGRGITNIAPGLGMALEFFNDRPHTGSRVILLVSDGAARIEPEIQVRLRQWFQRQQVVLYWIYLRNPNSASLYQRPANPDESTTPEYFLHEFFKSLVIPYRAFEAENPAAVKEAVASIGQLENKPIRYREIVPRRDLTQACLNTAFLALLLLFIAKSLEVGRWKT